MKEACKVLKRASKADVTQVDGGDDTTPTKLKKRIANKDSGETFDMEPGFSPLKEIRELESPTETLSMNSAFAADKKDQVEKF